MRAVRDGNEKMLENGILIDESKVVDQGEDTFKWTEKDQLGRSREYDPGT